MHNRYGQLVDAASVYLSADDIDKFNYLLLYKYPKLSRSGTLRQLIREAYDRDHQQNLSTPPQPHIAND